MQPVLLPKNAPRTEPIGRLIRVLSALPEDKAYTVEVKERKRTRSLQQNAYLWGVCYATILREGGEALAGWTADDLHQFFLGEHFGWETLEGFGRKRVKPLRRSSKLSTTEFMDFVAFIQQRAAEMGIVIPDPNEGAE